MSGSNQQTTCNSGNQDRSLDLAARVQAGDVRAVSRLISLIENNAPEAFAILARLPRTQASAIVIGITGYPGAGKSTLIDQLIRTYRRQGKNIGVLAVDVTSPLTRGAILGDRIRMQDHACDPGVYIRSMATRGHAGGLALATKDAALVLQAAGFEIVLIETIGVGQAEVDIAGVADLVVLVVAPGLGDDVQAMKAGILEMVDVIVVNKADREGADTTAQALEDWTPRVFKTVAVKGEGIEPLVEALAAFHCTQSGRPTRLPGNSSS